MNNDFDGMVWADNHHAMSGAIGQFFGKLAYVFELLVAIEYEAPWERTRR